jgi:hypothetical protein
MPRIQPLSPDTADAGAAELFDTVRQKMGGAPNRILTAGTGNTTKVAKVP